MFTCNIHLLHHLFYQPVSGGAVFDVLFEHMHIVHHPAACMMGKSGAVAGTNSIDAAFIIIEVQELAGLTLVHPITLAVFVQPFLAKGFGAHVKVCRNTLYVGDGISGTHGFATVGALKTVSLLPNSFISLCGYIVQSAGWIFF
jgi:hypothetical protein